MASPMRKVKTMPLEHTLSSEEMRLTDDDTNRYAHVIEKDNQSGLTPDIQMKRGLIEASRSPASLNDIRSFQTLHSPRLHGMAEWWLQYESAHRRQDEYLQQLHHLRLQFRYGNEKGGSSRAPGTSGFPRTRSMRKDYWLPHNHSSDAHHKFPHQVCVLHPRPHRKQITRPEHGDAKGPPTTTEFLMAPKFHPDVSDRNVSGSATDGVRVRLPPIGVLSRQHTDYEYERIEHIAQRNKLNLNEYLKPSLSSQGSGSTWAETQPRETVNVTEVYVQMNKAT